MIIGTCSICGGAVEVPDVWYSVDPAPATCRSCGAVKRDHGPVVDMKPGKDYRKEWQSIINQQINGRV
ncbi:MAG: hypothetical protein JEZ12_21525 [Desulfobacterium sp.]|nr:hypothetical protein [Desulfobacterium sp.]